MCVLRVFGHLIYPCCWNVNFKNMVANLLLYKALCTNLSIPFKVTLTYQSSVFKIIGFSATVY